MFYNNTVNITSRFYFGFLAFLQNLFFIVEVV